MKIKSIWFDRARQAGMTYSTIVSITVLSIVSTLSEAFGIGMFLPIFQYMRFDGDLNALIQDSNIWEYVVELFVRAGIDMSLQALLAVAFFIKAIIYIPQNYLLFISNAETDEEYKN